MPLCRPWLLPRLAATLAAAVLLSAADPSRADDIDKVRDAAKAKLPDLRKRFAKGAGTDPQTAQILKRTRIDSVEKGMGNDLEFKGVCLYVELNAPAPKAEADEKAKREWPGFVAGEPEGGDAWKNAEAVDPSAVFVRELNSFVEGVVADEKLAKELDNPKIKVGIKLSIRTLNPKDLKPKDQPHVFLQEQLVARGIDDALLESSWYDENRNLVIDGHVGREAVKATLDEIVGKELADQDTVRPPDKAATDKTWVYRFDSGQWPVSAAALQAVVGDPKWPAEIRRFRVDRAYFSYSQPDKQAKQPRKQQFLPELIFQGTFIGDGAEFTAIEPKLVLELLAPEVARAWAKRGWADYKSPGTWSHLAKQPPSSERPVATLHEKPRKALQQAIAGRPALDGCKAIDGTAFAPDGRLSVACVWPGREFEARMTEVVADVLGRGEGKTLLGGKPPAFDAQVVNTDAILRGMQEWAAENLEDTRLDRLYFNANFRLELEGVCPSAADPKGGAPAKKDAAVPDDATRVLLELRRRVNAHPQKDLLLLATLDRPRTVTVASTARLQPPADDVLQDAYVNLKKLAGLSDYLRLQMTQDSKWQGVLIERGYFTPDGRYTVRGLVDQPEQITMLTALLRDLAQDAGWSPYFAKEKAPTLRMDVIPLAGLVTRLKDVMPAYPVFDGMRVLSGRHGPAGELQLVVLVVRPLPQGVKPEETSDLAAAVAELNRLILAHPQYARRLPPRVGRIELKPQRITPDSSRGEEASHQALGMLIRAYPPIAWTTRWEPYSGRQVSEVAKADLAEGREVVAVALLHSPDDSTLWFLSALYNLVDGDDQLANRDMRRMVQAERDAAAPANLLSEDRLTRVERVQGYWRALMGQYQDKAVLDLAVGRPPLSLADRR